MFAFVWVSLILGYHSVNDTYVGLYIAMGVVAVMYHFCMFCNEIGQTRLFYKNMKATGQLVKESM
jgi:hypothetical protein